MRMPRFMKRSGATCFTLTGRLLAQCLLKHSHRLSQIEQIGNFGALKQERQRYCLNQVGILRCPHERNLITNAL